MLVVRGVERLERVERGRDALEGSPVRSHRLRQRRIRQRSRLRGRLLCGLRAPESELVVRAGGEKYVARDGGMSVPAVRSVRQDLRCESDFNIYADPARSFPLDIS
eukprot:3345120-Rhodomonas_salina.3